MSLSKRLKIGAAANSANLFFVSALQLLSLPVLTHAWGVESYGQWLMLTTIPSYLALADFGFGQAATSDMAMRIARDDRDGARATFQSIWVFVLFVSAVVISLASLLLIASLPLAHVLFLLVAYSAVGQCSRVVLAGFRSSGHYARGTIAYDTMWFCEWLSVLLVAWLGGRHVQCALALLVSRLVFTIALYGLLRASVPWLSLGYRDATRKEVRRLAKPALGALAIPTALALNLQGMVLVVGAAISPASAATFAAVRTISRIGMQLAGTLNQASMPEVSAAHATGDSTAVRKILRANAASFAFLIVPGAILFAVFGGRIVEIWSHGKIHPDPVFVDLMAVGVVIHSIWYYASNLLMATNSHAEFALVALPVSVLEIAAAIFATHAWGLQGAAGVLIAADLVSSVVALRLLLRQHPTTLLRAQHYASPQRPLPATQPEASL